MGRTRIELLSSGDIDMYDDVASPLTFSIADIRTPDKRDASFSKTIKVPGTKGNNIRFGHIFDVNIGDGTFNPNVKAPCTIYIDDVAQLSGFLQVLTIDIDDEKRIEYNISIKGKTATLFDTLGSQELTALDFSSGDHVYNKANQKASWANNFTQTYCYPLIDYGYDNNINSYDVAHLFPAIFVRSYVDKIFSQAGYTYTSTFFDSTRFKKLIIPTNSKSIRLTDTQIAPRLFQSQLAAPYSTNIAYSFGVTSAFTTLTIDTDVTDVSNQFNTATYKWTVATTGYYNVNCNFNIDQGAGKTCYVGIRKNSTTMLGTTMYSQPSGSPTGITSNVNASNVYLVAGDIIDICLSPDSSLGTPRAYTVNSAVFWNAVVNNGIQDGETLILNNSIPLKIKQKDFLLDLIRMFNLFVQVDPNNEKNLLIETRNDFYTNGTTVDWTYKLDNSKNLELRPMGDLDVRDFYYSYTDDKDYYNKTYVTDNQLNYGNRIYNTGNEFLTGKNETKVMFSPTPLVAPSGDDRVISKIWNVDASNVVTPSAFNIRILYNGGIKTTANPYSYTSTIAGTSTENQYLYAGHLDSVTAPTFDLSFAVPNEVYYDATIYTNNNVFNVYHKQYIDLITDKDSKIVTGYFYLTPLDILTLDFRNTFYFDNQSFYLNKIYDYDPINQQTTKCEFIRLKNGASWNGATKYIYGGKPSTWNSSGSIDYTPVVVGQNRSNTSVVNNGYRNNIGAGLNNSFIQGGDNYVHGGENIMLINSSGCTVYDGLTNVTLINSSGTIVSQSNVTYINGVAIPNGSNLVTGTGTDDYVTKWNGTTGIEKTNIRNNSNGEAFFESTFDGEGSGLPMVTYQTTTGGTRHFYKAQSGSGNILNFYENGVLKGLIQFGTGSNGYIRADNIYLRDLASNTTRIYCDALGNVAIGTHTPNSKLDVTSGSITMNYSAITSNYTLTANDYTVGCSNTITINLPTAVGIRGRVYNIKNIGVGVITIDANGTETIDGALTQTLNTQYLSYTLQSDGSNWIII